MIFRHAVAVLAASGILLAAPAAFAQTAPDFTKFNTACMGASAFLLGEVPAGVDSKSILTPLCGCLVTAFTPLTQKDVDVLATDLDGSATDASHTAYGDYTSLLEKAKEGLTTCFASPEVQAAINAAKPPAPATPDATTPAAPAAPDAMAPAPDAMAPAPATK